MSSCLNQKQLHNKQKLNEILLKNLNNFGFDGKKINPKIKETVKLESIKKNLNWRFWCRVC